MSSEKVRVPSSSLGELNKIIMGYVDLGKDVGLEALSKRLGMSKPAISGNNPFLTQVGVITGGNRKNPTDLGVLLGRSLEHSQKEDIKKYWQQAIASNEFLSGLVSTVRLKGGMTEDDLASHVLYAGGLRRTKHSATGANAIVEILKESELLQLDPSSGKLQVAKPVSEVSEETPSEGEAPPIAEEGGPEITEEQEIRISEKVVGVTPTIAINIELKIPPSENPVVYENLFSALRKHLLEPKGKDNE